MVVVFQDSVENLAEKKACCWTARPVEYRSGYAAVAGYFPRDGEIVDPQLVYLTLLVRIPSAMLSYYFLFALLDRVACCCDYLCQEFGFSKLL